MFGNSRPSVEMFFTAPALCDEDFESPRGELKSARAFHPSKVKEAYVLCTGGSD